MKKQYLIVWQHPISKEWLQTHFGKNTHTSKRKAITECKRIAHAVQNITYGVIEVNPVFTVAE